LFWSSDDTNVASVNASTGVILGVGAGNCAITVEFKYLDGETWTSFDPAIDDSIDIEVVTE
jgi:hypothetical protein